MIAAYLEILDYKKASLTRSHLLHVYESLDYATAIDHGLSEHLLQTASSLGLQSDPSLKLHHALYFLKSKGYLTTADLIREIASNKSEEEPIVSSDIIKS